MTYIAKAALKSSMNGPIAHLISLSSLTIIKGTGWISHNDLSRTVNHEKRLGECRVHSYVNNSR